MRRDIINGIAYAGEPTTNIEITNAVPLDDFMMIITMSTGEKRLYDASQLLVMPAFELLANKSVFMNPSIDHGVVTWMEGDIDIAPETMYHNSYPYSDNIQAGA